jgi:hypothetical protein
VFTAREELKFYILVECEASDGEPRNAGTALVLLLKYIHSGQHYHAL